MSFTSPPLRRNRDLWIAVVARGLVAATNGIASAAMIGAFVLGGVLAAFASPRQIFLIAGLLGMLAPRTLGRWLLGACRSAGADRVLTST
jgi:MFS family permease